MDQSAARDQIREGRQSQDRLELVIHDDVRWKIVLQALDLYILSLVQ